MSVLGVVSVGSLSLAGAVMVRWGTHRRDALGRARDLPVWSVSALVAVAVVAAVPGAQRRAEEQQLARVASLLAGRTVSVHCQDGAEAFVDAGSELGWVPFDANGRPEPHTLIKREQCGYLKSYMHGDQRNPSYDEVVAVHVLTHESMHMRGQPNEAMAECEAVQRDAVTAAQLGATPQEAHELAVRYWQTVYPQMPDGYFTRDCAPGGTLDEGLPTAPWLESAPATG